ncbi:MULTISPECIES: DUF3592 domain-containing protein [Nocardiaceae]|uniref:DUF3592 domain-containing protein n=1 Tax=Rhodococcoides kyotonense TaxID=398843 RepID=A0A177YAE6_9NOCA|nr:MULTISPECIES: DUF3592 domain-containing protein [Rhodococcus]OAK52340.1 hypothetical protein A3K89_24635 [Rhodococcus kyotonensis]RRQ29649.1 DUF3592 domain-containing protein [Rhodococcus sp. Eu-32]
MASRDSDDGRSQAWRRARICVIVVATGISVLAVLLVVAAWKNDRTITSDEGTATAEVLSAGKLRSAVSFVTPDGVTHNPQLGVLYPTNLIAGQRIDVEYAKSDPDLVRVSGRDASVAIVPAGSVVVVTWAVAVPVLLLLRRRERQHLAV